MGLYIPFLSIVLDCWPVLKESEFMERRVVLATCVCILKYTTPKVLESWWKDEDRRR